MINKIRRIVLNHSSGKVILTDAVIKEIIQLVQFTDNHQPFIKVYKSNSYKNHYEFIRSVKISEDLMNKIVIDTLYLTPAKGFYRYEIFNSDGEMIHEIFTTNSDLI